MHVALKCSCGVGWVAVGSEASVREREVEFVLAHELHGHVTRPVQPEVLAPGTAQVHHAFGRPL